MVIGIFLGIIILAAAFGAACLAYHGFDNNRKSMQIIGTILCAALALTFLVVPFSFHTVDTGEIAVVKRLGEAKYERTAGTHFDLWFIKSYAIYDSKVQNIDISTAAYSSDAQTMNVAMTMQYQILSDKATEIAKQYGSLEALESRIQAVATEKAKSVLSSHKAMNIIADRAAMSPAVEKAVRDAIGDEYYVNVVTVVLTNIDFSDAFEVAVEEKMIAEQKQLKAEYEAKAKIVAAEAEAKANELLENSLTENILESKYLDKWNGILPSVVAGESASLMIPSLSN